MLIVHLECAPLLIDHIVLVSGSVAFRCHSVSVCELVQPIARLQTKVVASGDTLLSSVENELILFTKYQQRCTWGGGFVLYSILLHCFVQHV